MDVTALMGLLGVGFVAGLASGLVGVGGGVLFVPAIVLFLDESQVRAEATSLLAVVLVVIVGAWRQREYGNIRLREGLLVGALSPIGVGVGVVLANALPERALQLLFVAVQLYFAFELARRALRGDEGEPESARA